MAHLTIRLLGNFQLTYNDKAIIIQQVRQQSLLAYLVLHHQAPQTRQHLAFRFWPDSSEAQARANLRQALHHLRHTLPHADNYLHVDAQQVQWLPKAPVMVDLFAFAEQLRQAESANQPGQASHAGNALQSAVDLYQGDLLPDCYDEWIFPLREEWRARFINALDRLIQCWEETHDYGRAIAAAQRLLRHDPLHESTYRHLMRLYALNGERASALHTYHTCVGVLQRELGVEPHPTTQEAYARLLNTPMPPAALAGLSPRAAPGVTLVGRQAEWAILHQAWQRINHAGPAFVLIRGEAGIGKSRLAEELWHWVTQQGLLAARTRSYAAEGDLAYAPVIEWLRSAGLQAALHAVDPVWRSEIARLLPELLTQQPALPRPEPLDDRRQRQRLFEALARVVLAAHPPLLLLIDDLQWCDPETLAWLHYLLRFDPRARLLVVGTLRPEAVDEQHPLTALLLDLRNGERVIEIELAALNAAEVATLATQLAGPLAPGSIISGPNLTAQDLTQLYAASEGNPLFVVEMVRAGLQQGAGTAAFVLPTLPPKVQALIGARLQQLSPAARELAGLAATIGRAFRMALLAQASDLGDAALLQGLDELWQRRIIREQGAESYDFSHDRIREAAYAALSPVQRPVFHRRVAQGLAALYADELDGVSAQLAVHYERAGMTTEAIRHYQRAAAVEIGIFSHTSAIAYLDAGLRLLRRETQRDEKNRQIASLLITKAESLSVVRGFAVTEMAEICRELEALLPQLTDEQLAFQARVRLNGFYRASGAMTRAYVHNSHLLQLAERLGDPAAQISAWQAVGIGNLQAGRFAAARQYLEQVAICCRENTTERDRQRLENNGASGGMGNLAFVLWLLGYPDQARTQAQAALAFANQSGNPYRLVISPFLASLVYRYLRAVAETATMAETMLTLDAQYSIPISRVSGLIAQGWVWTQQGRLQEGIAQMRAGIDEFKAMNHTLYQTHRLGWLSKAQMQAGDWAAADATLTEAFAMADQSGQHSCDAELYRLRGEWQGQAPGGDLDAAEAAFRQAIDLARAQGSRSFELRAVTSLCRLWQRQGKQVEARALLAEIYGWFTEGFDTADLQAAKALLAELTREISTLL